MSPDTVIQVENVSKKYCKSLRNSMIYGVNDIVRNSLGLSSNPEVLRKNEFWAVNDVSFEVKKGETLGLIGPNGSGKTTMLKMLNGIFWPDKGKISINGKVGGLIEVGAGFHPMLTGKENIYINGAILGMSKKEIDEKFDAIVSFADIGDFLHTPVKNYSSGMYVRLGFSIAIHCKPDILLVDEILSVGDAKFRRRSFSKVNELIGDTTIVIVSHNMFQIEKWCDKVIYLDKGVIKANDTPEKVIKKYLVESASSDNLEMGSKKEEIVAFEGICMLDKKGNKIKGFNVFDDVKIVLEFKCLGELSDAAFSIRFYNDEDICVSVLEPRIAFDKNDRGRHRLEVDGPKGEVAIRLFEKVIKENDQVVVGFFHDMRKPSEQIPHHEYLHTIIPD